jgi:hypothetical protein
MAGQNKAGRWLTPRRLEMLRLLAKHGCLGAGEIHQLVDPARTRSFTSKDLAQLVARGCTRRFKLDPSQGATGEYTYQLTQKGADLLGVKLGSDDRREPSASTLSWRKAQRELVRTVERAGWRVIKSESYNSTHPRPQFTPHYLQVTKALRAARGWELRRKLECITGEVDETYIGEIRSYLAEDRLDKPYYYPEVPPTMNDFVAYTDDELLAVILILSRAGSGQQFWQKRLKMYEKLARKIFIYAVFEEETQALHYKPELNACYIRVTTLSNLKGVLEWIGNPPLPFGPALTTGRVSANPGS